MQNRVRMVLELGDDGSDEPGLHHCIGIADDAYISLSSNDSGVVHQVLVIVAIPRHLQQKPRVDLVFERANNIGYAGVILDDDDFEQITINILFAQIVEQVKAFTNAPIQQNQADFGAGTGTFFNELHLLKSNVAITRVFDHGVTLDQFTNASVQPRLRLPASGLKLRIGHYIISLVWIYR